MPARRRRTVSRSPTQRFMMWDRKVKGETYAETLENVKPLAIPRVQMYQAVHEYLIGLVKDVVSKYGEHALTHEYMWYAQKLWSATVKYRGRGLQYKADQIYLEYRGRNLNDDCLREIAVRLGVTISPIQEILGRVGIAVAPPVPVEVKVETLDALIGHFAEEFSTLLENWLIGWSYRKSATIQGSTSGSVTDYQIRVTVHYGAGADGGEHVYLNGKCRADFGDIRFTDSDKKTLLPYWVEEKVDGDYAVIWVKIPYIPISPYTRLFYIYYGKSDATSISNGFNTFPLYDDFEDGILNTNLWEYQIGAGGQVTEANGRLTLTKTTSGAYTWVRSKILLEGNYLYVLTLAIPRLTVPERQRVKLLSSTNVVTCPFDIGMFGDSYSQWYIFWNGNTNVWYDFNRLFYLHIKCSPSRVDYTWIRDDGSILYSNYYTPTATPVKIRVEVGDSDTRRGNIYVYHIYARKWIEPEPTIISWGSEESL